MDSRARAFTVLRSLGWDVHASFRHCLCIFFFILTRISHLSTIRLYFPPIFFEFSGSCMKLPASAHTEFG